MLYSSVPIVQEDGGVSGSKDRVGEPEGSQPGSVCYSSVPVVKESGEQDGSHRESTLVHEQLDFSDRASEKPLEASPQVPLEAIPIGVEVQAKELFQAMTLLDALVLHLSLGLFGAVHFRMGRIKLGCINLCTLGCFGVGFVIDLLRLPLLVSEYNSKRGRMQGSESGTTLTMDCYSMLVLNLFGANHFYLGRYRWGAVYLCTIGMLGCGFLADLFRMRWLVKYRFRGDSEVHKASPYRLSDAYVCWFPCGLFGAHYFYLGKPLKGVVYLCTIGLFGLGWIADGFRLPRYVTEANLRTRTPIGL